MRLLRVLRQRFRSVWRRPAADAELERELALHLEQLQREHIGRGLSPEEALFAARRELGNLALLQEQCRDHRRVNWLDDLRRDFSHAWRLLRKSPGFTAVAVLSLALGIGANTAIFTLVKRALLDQLPVRDPEQLVSLSMADLERASGRSLPHPFFRELAEHNSVFDGLLCRTSGRATLVSESGAEVISVEMVSGNFYQVLGIQPFLGRLLTPEDDRTPGGHPVIVLTHNFWRRRFASDPSVVGKTLRLNTHPMTVIGVSPPGFDGLDHGYAPDAVVSVMMQAEVWQSRSQLASRGDFWLRLTGRLKPGVSLRQAEESATAFLRAYYDQVRPPRSEYERRLAASRRIEIAPIARGMYQNTRAATSLLALLAVVAIVLVIACVNVANLLLARACTRRREIALRLALGATRFRVMRQLLAESILLAVLGGALGLGLAMVSGRFLLLLIAGDSPNVTLDPGPDSSILLFTAGLSLLCGLVFGLAPAWQSVRQDLAAGIQSGRTVASGRLLGRKLLLSAQVALSLLLLAGAGLFLRTLQAIHRLDIGFQPEHLLQATMMPKNAGYRDDQVLPFFDRVIEQVRAVPGVRSASFALQRVMANSSWGSGITVEGYTPAENDRGPLRNAVGPDYFKTLGIPIVRGREFTVHDGEKAPMVAIVNETFARFYFGDRDPIGRRIDEARRTELRYAIVGVAKDGKYIDFRDDNLRFWYVPIAQSPVKDVLTLYARTAGDPERSIGLVRHAIAAVDKNVALLNVRSVEAQIAQGQRQERLLAVLSAFFGALSALLAAIGLSGVLSYSVNQRFREIGIRMALGASPGGMARMVLREVGLYAGLGFALGLPAAAAAARAIKTLLFGVEPLDAWALVGACFLMAAVVLLSGYIPARRAAAIDPAVTLRSQ